VVEEHRDLARPVGPALDVRVHDRPATGIVAALERNPERLPEAAVHAVARDEEARAELLGPHPRQHALVVLAHQLYRLAPLHRSLEMLAQELLELTLAQADGGRERAVDPGEVEPRDLPAARGELNARNRHRRREHRLRDPGVVPQLEAAGVEVGGPRDGGALPSGVDGPVLDAVPLELAGEAKPDRAGAGDQHPDVHPPSLPPGAAPKVRRPVAVIRVCHLYASPR
jgi:hypothetical protein